MSSRKTFKNSQAGRLLSSISKPEQERVDITAPDKEEALEVKITSAENEKTEEQNAEFSVAAPEKAEIPEIKEAANKTVKMVVPEEAAIISKKEPTPEAKVKIMIEIPMSASIQINRVIDQQLMEGKKLTRKQFCINAILKALEELD